MRRLFLLVPPLLALVAPAHAQQAIWESWGKPGVAFDRYRGDAVECGRAGVHTDIAGTAAVAALRRGTRELEANDRGMQAYGANETPAQIMDRTVVQANQYQRIREGVRPDVRVAEVKRVMQDVTWACLAARGYIRFRLTPDQHGHLARLRIGQPERHRYLYRLASDPEVLARQAVR